MVRAVEVAPLRAWVAAALSGIIALAPNAYADEPAPAPAPATPPATPPTPYASPSYPAYPPPAPVYSRELVFTATEAEAELQIRQRDQDGKLVWHPICTRSCTTPAFFGAEYRVSGPGISSSRAFKVDPGPYPLYLRADAGSTAWRTAGLVILPAGGAAMVVGIVVLTLSGCSHCDDSEAPNGVPREAITVGLPLLIGGAALVAGGIVLIISNRTKLQLGTPGFASSPRVDLGRGFAIGPQGFMF